MSDRKDFQILCGGLSRNGTQSSGGKVCGTADLVPSQISVVIHPQSIVHSMVEYLDGSFLAQLGSPDMCTPIAYALSYPDRIESGVQRLNPLTLGQLQFEAPDNVRFPCLRPTMR